MVCCQKFVQYIRMLYTGWFILNGMVVNTYVITKYKKSTFSECTTKSSTSTKGVCFTTTECQEKGGNADGNCASSFGVCCMFR